MLLLPLLSTSDNLTLQGTLDVVLVITLHTLILPYHIERKVYWFLSFLKKDDIPDNECTYVILSNVELFTYTDISRFIWTYLGANKR